MGKFSSLPNIRMHTSKPREDEESDEPQTEYYGGLCKWKRDGQREQKRRSLAVARRSGRKKCCFSSLRVLHGRRRTEDLVCARAPILWIIIWRMGDHSNQSQYPVLLSQRVLVVHPFNIEYQQTEVRPSPSSRASSSSLSLVC